LNWRLRVSHPKASRPRRKCFIQYLTGPRFRLRVQAIVEAFSNMKEDLDKERKVITKQWAKREEQIERVMQATVGMYGDMQGIAGKTLQEIEGLEMKALEDAKAIPAQLGDLSEWPANNFQRNT
jgi:hypothetical protein